MFFRILVVIPERHVEQFGGGWCTCLHHQLTLTISVNSEFVPDRLKVAILKVADAMHKVDILSQAVEFFADMICENSDAGHHICPRWKRQS